MSWDLMDFCFEYPIEHVPYDDRVSTLCIRTLFDNSVSPDFESGMTCSRSGGELQGRGLQSTLVNEEVDLCVDILKTTDGCWM